MTPPGIQSPDPITFGLTGSIGMGKTTVAAMFRDEGVPIFDSDAAVHALYGGPAARLVDAAFPGVLKDGVVDRASLSARVLGDAAALKRLESIVHPMVRVAREAFREEARTTGARLAGFDVPLLFETGGDAEVDVTVVVSASEAVQKARVMARAGMTMARFSAILAKQMPDAEKRRRATFVVDTGVPLSETRAEVRRIISTLAREVRPTEP